MKRNLDNLDYERLIEQRKIWLDESKKVFPTLRGLIALHGQGNKIHHRNGMLYEFTTPSTGMPVSAWLWHYDNRWNAGQQCWDGNEVMLITGGKMKFIQDRYRESILCNITYLFRRKVDETIEHAIQSIDAENYHMYEPDSLTIQDTSLFIPGDWLQFMLDEANRLKVPRYGITTPTIDIQENTTYMCKRLLSGVDI